MPRPCSDDLRMNAVKKVTAGESCRSVAKQLRVAASSVIKWIRRYLDTGSVSPSRMGARRTPKLAGHRSWILERIKACPAVTLAGLRDWIGARLLFLPPYSPDLNPIKQAFAKLKHFLMPATRRFK